MARSVKPRPVVAVRRKPKDEPQMTTDRAEGIDTRRATEGERRDEPCAMRDEARFRLTADLIHRRGAEIAERRKARRHRGIKASCRLAPGSARGEFDDR